MRPFLSLRPLIVTITLAVAMMAVPGALAQSLATTRHVSPAWPGEAVLRADLRTGAWQPDRDPLEAKRTPIGTIVRHGKRIRAYQVRYTSHSWQGKPVRIFGFYAAPEGTSDKSGKYPRRPALLLVHGGGGHATIDRVLEAADQGFAALAIDLPGKGTNRERTSRSTGPDFTVKQIFTVAPSPRESYLYHAIRAEMRAITFLAAQPEVDSKRIGLVGASWGGATGLIVTSLDPRVRCFADIFGAGYVRDGSTWQNHIARMPPGTFATWEANFDASRYAPDIHVPVLGVAATNDGCYWLPQFLRTMRVIGVRETAPSRRAPDVQLITLPNRDHKIDPTAHAAVYYWLQARLAGKRVDAPALTGNYLRVSPTLADLRGSNNLPLGRFVAVSLTAPPANHKITRVEIACAPILRGDNHHTRTWKVVPAIRDTRSGTWHADLPASTTLTYAFATVYGADGSMVSTTITTIARADVPGRGLTAFAVPFLTNRPAVVLARNAPQIRMAQHGR